MANKQGTSKPGIPFNNEDFIMQAQLRMLGVVEVGNIDGRKGPKTNAAMENFAKKNGLNGADENTVRAKIAEQYAALKVTPDKINRLMGSGDINDVKAGQIAFNLQNPGAGVRVDGISNNRTHTQTGETQAPVVMRSERVPPMVTAPESPNVAQSQVQQRSYGTVQQPQTSGGYQQQSPEQEQIRALQRQNQELAERNQNQTRMIEEMRSPQNIQVGQRGTVSEYFNQRSQPMDLRTRQSDQNYDLRSRSMDQRDRQIDMQETRSLMQMGIQMANVFQRFHR